MMSRIRSKFAWAIVAAVLISLGGVSAISALGQPRSTRVSGAAATAPSTPAARKGGAGITGVADAPPVVVSTVPRAGDDQVDPNLKELKVTFSKEMTDGNWSWAQISDDTFPKTTGKPHYLDDHRTCVLPVKLEPGRTYVIFLNVPPFDSFCDTDGRKAVRYPLVFETKGS